MVFMDFVVFGIYQVFILDTKKPLPLVQSSGSKRSSNCGLPIRRYLGISVSTFYWLVASSYLEHCSNSELSKNQSNKLI
jgi:hypothetical protein